MSITLRRKIGLSTRGQQATPKANNPKPATRVTTTVASEISVPNKSLTVFGANINAIPVTVSNVEATASSSLFILSPGVHIVVVAAQISLQLLPRVLLLVPPPSYQPRSDLKAWCRS